MAHANCYCKRGRGEGIVQICALLAHLVNGNVQAALNGVRAQREQLQRRLLLQNAPRDAQADLPPGGIKGII